MGAIGSTARSLAAKSQTNLVLSVRSACFATQERNAPCSRLMPLSSAIGEASRRIAVSWPGEASRPYCRSWPICGASRPLTPTLSPSDGAREKIFLCDVTRGGARSLRTATRAYPGLLSCCPFRALIFSPRPSAISENRKRSDGSSRARSAATRVRAAPAIFAARAIIISWARPLVALTVSSDLTTSKCSAMEAESL